jgi:DNA-binding response OmpR family regulator
LGRDVILVVEDDESARVLLEMALVDEGYDVVTAKNGAVGLTIALDRRPKLILLDLRMPVMDGWQFARAYRERAAEPAPIVLLTAGSDRDLARADLPGDALVRKPFDLDELLAIVRPLVRGDVGFGGL